MTKGRPKLPEGECMVTVSLRLPEDLVDWYGGVAEHNRSQLMRAVLEYYKRKATQRDLDTV